VIRRPFAILVLLTGLNLLNYMDRMVLSAVLPRVQDALGLSGFVAGGLSTIFLLGYFLTSPFFGAVGDRMKRTPLIAGGVLVWSAATVASGLATTAGGLVAARVLVGVGEASYATLAPTIIDDISPTERKGRWLAYFYAASPIGAALGYLVGGFVEKHMGWRSAFFVAGGPGVVLALSCLLVAEPARKIAKEKVALLSVMLFGPLRDAKELWPIRLYRRGVLGYAAFTFAIGGFSYWAPSFLFRRFDMSLAKANFVFGVVTVVGGAIGTAVGGFFADRRTRRVLRELETETRETGGPYREDRVPAAADLDAERDRRVAAASLRVCAIGTAIAAPLALVCFLAPSSNAFFVTVFFCEVALFATTSPINVVTLRSVPAEARARAMALSIFAIHLLGDLWSPPFVGLLADHLPIAMAMQSLPVAIAIGAALWWVRGRR
jgi:MFS family permease